MINYFENNLDSFSRIIYEDILNKFNTLDFRVIWLRDFGVCFEEIHSKSLFWIENSQIVFIEKNNV